MHEGDATAMRPGAGRVVDQAVTRRAAAVEGGVEIRYFVADVMNAGATLRQELRDRAVGRGRLEEFHLGAAKWQGDNRGTVRRFGGAGLESENISVEGKGVSQVLDGDADVGDAWLKGHAES